MLSIGSCFSKRPEERCFCHNAQHDTRTFERARYERDAGPSFFSLLDTRPEHGTENFFPIFYFFRNILKKNNRQKLAKKPELGSQSEKGFGPVPC